MEKKTIEKIMQFVKETDLTEFALEKNEAKIYFRKGAAEISRQKAAAEKITETESAAGSVPEPGKKLITVRSPMVGTFYRSAANDRPPFVVAGGLVTPGKKVGVIEAMKVMKDVVSDAKGRIVKIMIENAHPVEYGQELFLVDPEE
jgi:acetyl-CoA carboxylase biotin carboxyl carrier protein